jgi:ATP-dependent Zn protease
VSDTKDRSEKRARGVQRVPTWLRALSRRKRTFAVLQPLAVDEMTYGTFSAHWIESHRVDADRMRDQPIVGIGHVQREIGSLLARLRNPQRVRDAGAEPPRGVLFWGKPGTGKTLTARHMALQLGQEVPFYELSSDELSPDRARSVLRFLADAHERAVLYIDEVDGFALDRDAPQHTPTTRAVLVAFLAALDGLVETGGPLVIASSNRHPAFLDDALTRPGRLGFAVAFDFPDEDERVQLLELFAQGRPTDGPVDWRRLAQLARGQSPAGLKQALDDAFGLALADERAEISEADVLEALRRRGHIVPEFEMQDDDLRRICAHEAGHVAVAVALQGPAWVHAVDVSERGGVVHVGDEHDTVITVPDETLRTRVLIAYAGMAAERVLFGQMSRPSDDDVAQATDTLLNRVETGLDRHFPPLSPSAFEQRLAEAMRTRLLELAVQHAEEAQHVAAAIVESQRDGIQQFAEELFTERSLTGASLQEAIARAGFRQTTDPETLWAG